MIIEANGVAPQQLRQMSVMPFDSGPEAPLGTPIRELMDWDFTADGTQLYTGTKRGAAIIRSAR